MKKPAEIRMFPYVVVGTADSLVAIKAINKAYQIPGGFSTRSANEVEVDGCSVTVTADPAAGEDLILRVKDPKSNREIEIPRYQWR